jgi:hypothetical protein
MRLATRETVDEFGQRLPLCDRCPTPEEIRQHTADLRTKWDELEHWCRRYGLPRDTAADVTALRVDEVSVLYCGLPQRHGKPAVPTEP